MWLRRSAALAAALFLVIILPAIVLGASPEPSPGSGDTRSAGEAPGFVGAPLLAVAGVLVLGTIAAGATIAYVRLTGGPGAAAAGAAAAAAVDGVPHKGG